VQLGERLAELPDHLDVGDAVPHAAVGAVGARLRQRRPVEAEARAERLALRRHEHHLDAAITVGVVECRGQLVAQLRRDRVELRRTTEHESTHGPVVLDPDRGHA